MLPASFAQAKIFDPTTEAKSLIAIGPVPTQSGFPVLGKNSSAGQYLLPVLGKTIKCWHCQFPMLGKPALF
jgi:hypothetical protein